MIFSVYFLLVRYVKRIVRKGIGKIIYPIPFLSKYLLYYEYNLNNKLAI